MEEVIDRFLEDVCEKITKEKERLITLRIEERAQVKFDFIAERKKRFPRVKYEIHSNDQSEHWFWNDGSDNGLHLISFYADWPDYNGTDFKFNLGFKYR